MTYFCVEFTVNHIFLIVSGEGKCKFGYKNSFTYSSIWSWTYDVEICFRPSSSKSFNFAIPQPSVRVGARVSTDDYMAKGGGYGFNIRTSTAQFNQTRSQNIFLEFYFLFFWPWTPEPTTQCRRQWNNIRVSVWCTYTIIWAEMFITRLD